MPVNQRTHSRHAIATVDDETTNDSMSSLDTESAGCPFDVLGLKNGRDNNTRTPVDRLNQKIAYKEVQTRFRELAKISSRHGKEQGRQRGRIRFNQAGV